MPRPKIDEDDEDSLDDFDDEETDLESEEQEDVKPSKPVVKTVKREEMRQVPQQKSKAIDTSIEYVAFHNPERTGVMNKETREPVGEDILTILAVILTKLQKIEEAVC